MSNWKPTEEEESKVELTEILESYPDLQKVIPICETHSKENWTNHEGYTRNPDGSISCKFCGWGTPLPGYMRVIDGKIVDLRDRDKG